MLKQYVERQNVASHCLMSAEANVTVYEETETKEFGLNYCAFLTAKQPHSYNDVSISDVLTSEQRAEAEALVEQYPGVSTSVPDGADLLQHNIKLLKSQPIRRSTPPLHTLARNYYLGKRTSPPLIKNVFE